jgi:hypothetical protein
MEDFDYVNSIEILFKYFPELETSPYILEGWDIDIPYSLYSGFGNLLIDKIKNKEFKEADRMIEFISEISKTTKSNGIDLVLDLYETIEEDDEADKYFLTKLTEPGLSHLKSSRNWQNQTIDDQRRFRAQFH